MIHDIDESVHLGNRVLVLSAAPASVIADLPVDLPGERSRAPRTHGGISVGPDRLTSSVIL